MFSKDGKYLKNVTPDEIPGQIMDSPDHPNYKSINCPGLAIYAISTTLNITIPFYYLLDSVNKKKADTRFTIFKNFTVEQMERFKKEVKNGIVKEIKEANHYLFISNSVETENRIWQFLM